MKGNRRNRQTKLLHNETQNILSSPPSLSSSPPPHLLSLSSSPFLPYPASPVVADGFTKRLLVIFEVAVVSSLFMDDTELPRDSSGVFLSLSAAASST